jgi:hypothetical protein
MDDKTPNDSAARQHGRFTAALAGTPPGRVAPGSSYVSKVGRTMGLNVTTRRYLIAFLAIGGLATLVKLCANGIESGLAEFYSDNRSTSVEDARQKGVLVAVFKTEPMTVTSNGKTFEFGEAWLEAAYLPTHPFIWFSDRRRMDWNFLCVRPKTRTCNPVLTFLQEYTVTPEHSSEFDIPGRMHFRRWGEVSGETEDGKRYDLYRQMVPTDLREVKLKVDIIRDAGDYNIRMGTVTLTTVEE